MLDIKLYNGCSSPRYVYSAAAGRVIYTECGQCAYCLAKKSRHAAMRVQFNARKYKYCYFCTLDFAPEHLPLMRAYVLDSEYYCENVEGHIFDEFRNNLVPFSNWQGSKDEYVTIVLKQVQGTVPYDKYLRKRVPSQDTFRMTPSQFSELLKRIQPTTKSRIRVDCIPFANYLEFQNFFKRLKINLKRLGCNEALSYYIVTEYGPQTLRPHCHILLFFNEDFTSQIIRQACIKSWKFGGVDCSLATGKSIAYVAGYANSYATLPVLYKTSKIFKVRARSSVGFDDLQEVPCPSDEDEVHRFNSYLLDGVTTSSNDKSCTLVPSPAVVNALYPRFRGYDVSDAQQTARVLLSCKRAVNRFGYDCRTWDINSVSDYAHHLYCYLKSVASESIHQPYLNADDVLLLLAADLVNSRGFLYTRQDLDDIGVKSINDPYDLDEFLYKRLYRLCLMTYRFYKLWHYTDFNYHSLSKFLQQFYDAENIRRYQRLADYFKILQNDYDSAKVPYHAIARYKSSSSLLTLDNTDYTSHILFRDLEQINDSILKEKMKHKKLNDALGLWLTKNNLL